jgi:hypothetical protein
LDSSWAWSLLKKAADLFSILDGPGGRIIDIVLSLVAAIPGNAAMIGLTGASIGKWIFGIRVMRDGKPIGFANALAREFKVWWRGLGAGVPLVSLATLAHAFRQLTDNRITSWDNDQSNTVVHRAESLPATISMWAAAALIVAGYVALRV